MDENQVVLIAKTLKKQREKLDYSFRELSEKTGISSSTLQRYESTITKDIPLDKFKIICSVLNIDGSNLLFKSQPDSNFNLQLDLDFMQIPLYSSISAGYGSSQADFIEMVAVPGLKPNGTSYFAVKVAGDSMEPKIPNGSTVIIKKDISIENGEIGAFCYNDNSYVKQKKIVNDKLILHSFNLAHDPMVVQEYDDFKEYGKVVKVMIDL